MFAAFSTYNFFFFSFFFNKEIPEVNSKCFLFFFLLKTPKNQLKMSLISESFFLFSSKRHQKSIQNATYFRGKQKWFTKLPISKCTNKSSSKNTRSSRQQRKAATQQHSPFANIHWRVKYRDAKEEQQTQKWLLTLNEQQLVGFSLSLSLSLTHTNPLFLFLSLSLPTTLTHKFSLSLSLSLSLTLSLTNT